MTSEKEYLRRRVELDQRQADLDQAQATLVEKQKVYEAGLQIIETEKLSLANRRSKWESEVQQQRAEFERLKAEMAAMMESWSQNTQLPNRAVKTGSRAQSPCGHT